MSESLPVTVVVPAPASGTSNTDRVLPGTMATPRLASQDPKFAKTLFTGAGSDYDRLSEALSFGQYGVWQAALVRAAREHGIGPGDHVLDVATGTGKIATQLVAETGCGVTGLDLTRDMLRIAAQKREDPALDGHHRGLVQGTAERLPFPDATFDGLTFSYLYRYVADPPAVTRELLRVVKPDGFIGFIEFHVPQDPALRALWRLHTRINLPLFGSLGGAEWRRIGAFLGPNIESFYAQWSAESLAEMLAEAGCSQVEWRLKSLGGGLVMWGEKETSVEV